MTPRVKRDRFQGFLGSGANRLIGSVKVAMQPIWWSVISKRKGLEGLFDGRHFDREIIVLCVRCYLRYKLSQRDLVEMMAERGLSLAHAPTTEGSPRGIRRSCAG